jgi:hypothetical protein
LTAGRHVITRPRKRFKLTRFVAGVALLIEGEKIGNLAALFPRPGSGASQLGEGGFEEMGRLCSAPPGGDLTVLAIAQTHEPAGVWSS